MTSEMPSAAALTAKLARARGLADQLEAVRRAPAGLGDDPAAATGE